MADLCEWCGRSRSDIETYDYREACYCHPCVECKFTHDVGRPRAKKSWGQATSADGLVHDVSWSNGIVVFPRCWTYANHEVPTPTVNDYELSSSTIPVDCLECIALEER